MPLESLELFPALPWPIEAALRDSIKRFGVLQPVVRDQHGRTLDGYHRARVADDLGVPYRVDVVTVRDEAEALEIAHTLNADRRQLSPEQRQEAVKYLRELQHSIPAIAGALEVGKSTVARDLEELSRAGKLVPPAYSLGLDGKWRPARRTLVAAKTQQEAERAQVALLQLGDAAPATVMEVKRVERVAREHLAEQRRAQPVPLTSTDACTILHGDFREVLLALADASVDAIITDPPYQREELPLLVALSAVASRLLAPDGGLAVMYGQAHLCDAMVALATHLEYRWCACYLAPGQRPMMQHVRIQSGWKPIFLYQRHGAVPRAWLMGDVFVGGGPDKTHHHWGQNYPGIASMVERLSQPGDLVCDPFLGGGTVALACQQLGRRFVGCDVDAAAIHATLARLRQAE